jgi:hypothetical protein
MNKMYVIHWKSKVNGRAGTGTKLFDRDAARALVEELNREYPQIEHEMVEASSARTGNSTGSRSSEMSNEPMELMAAH